MLRTVHLINGIRIENFKSIRDLEIKLAHPKIFVGPDGSGKSSTLEAVALMKQCIVGVGEMKECHSALDFSL